MVFFSEISTKYSSTIYDKQKIVTAEMTTAHRARLPKAIRGKIQKFVRYFVFFALTWTVLSEGLRKLSLTLFIQQLFFVGFTVFSGGYPYP